MRLAVCAMLLGCGICYSQLFKVELPSQAKPYEIQAASELKGYLEKIARERLTVAGEGNVVFHVGDTEFARQKGLVGLQDEEWVVKSFGNQVVLIGGGTRGTFYAVCHFLEDVLDVHWWSEFEDYVPEPGPVELKALDLKGKPVFAYRDIYRSDSKADHGRLMVCTRRNRDGDAFVSAKFGGSFDYGPPYHAHTFDRYIPAAKYLESNPEYFSLVDGKRVGGQTQGQLCLTNPDLKALFLTQLREAIAKGEETAAKNQVPPPRLYEVSMNDNQKCCQCEACAEEIKKYNHSGMYINFVNELARDIAKTHPDIYISMLAYFYTEPPPKGGVVADKNVIIKLCDTKTNQAASILEPQNKIFKDFVQEWKKACHNLFIWDYAITFGEGHGMPFASEFTLADLFRFYHENKVIGVFWEQERQMTADMWELKHFMMTKLMENPYADDTALINLFMNKYYGKAAPHILNYRKRIHQARIKNDGHIGWFAPQESFTYLTVGDIAQCQQDFELAQKAVKGDQTLEMRVQRARHGLDLLTIYAATPLVLQGEEQQQTTKLDNVAAAKRILGPLRQLWLDRFPNGKRQKDAEFAKFSSVTTEKQAFPQPERFKGTQYYDLTPITFQNHAKDAITQVDDPDSQIGFAWRFDSAKSHYYDLPFAMGVYDVANAKGCGSVSFPKPLGKGYQWYKLGVVDVPGSAYFYLTRAWTIQISLARNELRNKKLEFWAAVKFTGPKYHPDAKPDEKNHIWVQRVIAIPQK